MYQKILVPLDGSAVAEVALPHAVQLAAMCHADIVLLRVAFAAAFTSGDPVAAESAAVSESATYLEQVAQARQSQELMLSTAIRYGNAAEEVLAYAEQQNISLIVMATHGRSGVGRWLLGSTAEKVLRGSTVPVLLIRATPGTEGKSS